MLPKKRKRLQGKSSTCFIGEMLHHATRRAHLNPWQAIKMGRQRKRTKLTKPTQFERKQRQLARARSSDANFAAACATGPVAGSLSSLGPGALVAEEAKRVAAANEARRVAAIEEAEEAQRVAAANEARRVAAIEEAEE
ncbi:unnamed protein product, partial [Ectocarpus sp. 12 AP-2014]